MKTVHVTVTQEDINAGRPTLPSSCPVALALLRCLELSRFRISVCVDTFLIYPPKEALEFYPPILVRLPSVVTEFIRAFDHNKKVYPFEFDVEVDFSTYSKLEF